MDNLEAKETKELLAEFRETQGRQKCRVISELIYRTIMSDGSAAVFDYLCNADKADNTVVALIMFLKKIRSEKQQLQKEYQDGLITEEKLFFEVERLSKEKDFLDRLLAFSGDAELVKNFFSLWINSGDFEIYGVEIISSMDFEKMSDFARQRLLKILSAYLQHHPDFLVLMYRLLDSMKACRCTECLIGNLKNVSEFSRDRKRLMVCFLEKLAVNNVVISFGVLAKVMDLRDILGTYVSKLAIRMLARMLSMVCCSEDIISLTEDITKTELLPLKLKLQMLSRIAIPALDYGLGARFLEIIHPVFKCSFPSKLIKYPEQILHKLLGYDPELTKKVFDTAWEIQNIIVDKKDLWRNTRQYYNEMRLPDLMMTILFYEMETEPRVFSPERYMALVMHYLSGDDALLCEAVAKDVFESFSDESYEQMEIETFCRLIDDLSFEPGSEASMYLMRVIMLLMKKQPQSENLILEFCKRKELLAELV